MGELLLEVRGVGGHAGDPRGTIDPIVIAARIILELERIGLDRSGHAAVARIALISAGTASNVIPATARLAGTIRTMSDRCQLLTDVRRLICGTAEAAGGTVELSFGASCPPVVGALGTDRVIDATPGTGADDMGRVLASVPGCYFRVGISDPTAGPPVPHHHPLFDLDERALPVAAEALTHAPLSLLRPA